MATFLNRTSEKPDGFIGLYTAKIGDEYHKYVYLAHLSEPHGFSTAYPNPFDYDDFDLGLSAFGLWDSVEELKENFKKYVEAHGFDSRLTAILPVSIRKVVRMSVSDAIINPQD